MFHHSIVFNEGESSRLPSYTLSWTFLSSSDPSTCTQWIVNKWKNHEKRVAAMKMIMRWGERRNGGEMTFCWKKGFFPHSPSSAYCHGSKNSLRNELLQLILRPISAQVTPVMSSS